MASPDLIERLKLHRHHDGSPVFSARGMVTAPSKAKEASEAAAEAQARILLGI